MSSPFGGVFNNPFPTPEDYARGISSGTTHLSGGQNSLNSIAKAAEAPQQSRYKTITIRVYETSNGHTIEVGMVKRVCKLDDNLIDEIAAAMVEAGLK